MAFYSDKKLKSVAVNSFASKENHKAVYVLHLFFLVSLAGWIGESVFFVIIGAPADRGFLTLPFCPVYGFTVCGIYLFIGTPSDGIWWELYGKLKRNGNLSDLGSAMCVIVLYYIAVTFCVTFSEFIGGLFFDKALKVRLWNYSGFAYNVMGYVCPQFSFLFGAAASLFAVIADKVILFLKRVSDYETLIAVDVVLSALMAADFVFNVIAVIIIGEHLMLYGTHV